MPGSTRTFEGCPHGPLGVTQLCVRVRVGRHTCLCKHTRVSEKGEGGGGRNVDSAVRLLCRGPHPKGGNSRGNVPLVAPETRL